MQSECNELKGQLRDFERIKERNGLLQEMLDKTKEENQKLNQEVILAKAKLAAKVESEKELKEAKIKLEENLQTMQAKCENLTIQLESTKVKLDLESKINSMETQNKELQEQVNELKVSQRTQMEIEQTVHQQEQEKEQQKQNLIQEKISRLEGSLKQLQELLFTSHLKVISKSALKSISLAKTSIINLRGTDCTKEDLIKIIEAHVNQIEDLHQQIHTYGMEIVRLQQKLKCVFLYL